MDGHLDDKERKAWKGHHTKHTGWLLLPHAASTSQAHKDFYYIMAMPSVAMETKSQKERK